jgi:hypothetical protein
LRPFDDPIVLTKNDMSKTGFAKLSEERKAVFICSVCCKQTSRAANF